MYIYEKERNPHFDAQFRNGYGAILELRWVSYQVIQIFNPTGQRRNYWTKLEYDIFSRYFCDSFQWYMYKHEQRREKA